MREKSRPQGRGALELRELLPLGITHTPLWLLWGRGNPSHGTLAEQVSWSSPSHCQLPWQPCGQGISVTSSAEALPGPVPSLRGAQSWGWGRAGAGAALGHLLCRAPALQLPWLCMFASSTSCTGQPQHRRVPGCVQAMATQEVEQPSHLALVLG